MSTNTIPERQDGTTIFASWANDIRTALAGDVVPRNVSGVPTDQAGSIGSTSYKWLDAFFHNLYLYNSTLRTKISRASGGSSHELILPNALDAGERVIAFANDGTGRFLTSNQTLSSSSGTFSTSSASFIDVTNLSAAITTKGRDIEISLEPDGTSNAAYVGISFGTVLTTLVGIAELQIMRDASVLRVFRFGWEATGTGGNSGQSYAPPGDFRFTDTGVSSGTYTYKAQVKVTSGGGSVFVSYVNLRVREKTE